MYSIVEIFTSLQGEGRFVGHPVNFIRLAGCSMGCKFCDTDIKERETLTAGQILTRLSPAYSSIVVLTGGEPLEQDCEELVVALHDDGYSVHLETNGKWLIWLRLGFDWISMSPKRQWSPSIGNLRKVSEIKWLVPEWPFEKVLWGIQNFPGAEHYVQPVNDRLKINKKALRTCLEYIARSGGRLKLSVQLHKLIGVR